MINHLIWIAGLLAHLLLLIALFTRKRAAVFPWFTLLIAFYLVRSAGLVIALRISGHPAPLATATLIDLVDVLLQFAVLAELSWVALQPLGRLRRVTMPLLLLASGIVIVLRLSPPGQTTPQAWLVLLHFLLSVLMVEWGIVIAFLRRPLRLSWRSDVAAISLGFGIYSAVLLAGGSYFTTGREMRDYVIFSYLRVVTYLLVVVSWAVSLWRTQRPEDATPRPGHDQPRPPKPRPIEN